MFKPILRNLLQLSDNSYFFHTAMLCSR